MKTLKVVFPAVLAIAGLFLSTTVSQAKLEYSKKEKKSCTFCHVKQGSKDLNEAGTYYKEKKSLDGFEKK